MSGRHAGTDRNSQEIVLGPRSPSVSPLRPARPRGRWRGWGAIPAGESGLIVLPYRNRSRFRAFGAAPYGAGRGIAAATPADGGAGGGDVMNTGMNWSLNGEDMFLEGDNNDNNDDRGGVDG